MHENKEQMNIVIVGHVDHGKSTLIGRLLADTGSLPEGKLDQVKAVCAANAKPFEYAFLLDALKDEQEQGITIDTARSFFKTKKRDYIIIDAPGHIEFLKNMITGAARAEAALLLIDANEGVKENSKRHGYMLSMLGIKQIAVVVNKMDLVDYDEKIFNEVTEEYGRFLKEINVKPMTYVPISAFNGDNLISVSEKTPWYKGDTVLDIIDLMKKEKSKEKQAFRFPVQGVYKFTEDGDDRRIVAGSVETGTASVGDEVIFYPSRKSSVIKSIESFNADPGNQISAGQATGVTLETQIYIKPGELMVKTSDIQPQEGSAFKANIFWLGKTPMIKDKRYKLKLSAARTTVYLHDVVSVLDASDLSKDNNRQEIRRHDVAETILQTLKPIGYDLAQDLAATSRFVIIDDYEIAGGGIITEAVTDDDNYLSQYIQKRNFSWERSAINAEERSKRFGQKPKFIVITGPTELDRQPVAAALEEALFKAGKSVYYMGISALLGGIGSDLKAGRSESREEHLRRLGEVAHVMTDAGLIFISTIPDLDDSEATIIKSISGIDDVLLVNIGPSQFNTYKVDSQLDPELSTTSVVEQILELLYRSEILIDYVI